MGKRGPQPQPIELKRLRGNPGKRAIKEVPKGEALCPPCPADLKHIKGTWDHYGEILSKLGILRDTDGIAWEMLWRTWKGYLGSVKDDDLRAQLTIIKAIIPLLDRFGMSPTSRSSLSVEAPKEESEFERFVNKMKTAK